ncbi:MAG TPA: lipase secretion chaperone [Steroidobacteraceae bacterium]|nr:lipase secretion chaperone [Steroidobacteraceae bacterium]
MLSIATPSVVQQRIALVVFFAALGLLAWWQNASDTSDHPVQKFTQTRLPDVFNELDFTNAEAAWSSLQIDSHGNLKIDALTETALVDAMALMQDQASEPTMTRMAFLLEKQFGVVASQQIIDLLPVLKSYKEAEQRWWDENGSRDPPPHAELFRLQDELLGETLAQQMFSEQRRLANMMLASQRIRNDASLTQAQKDQALIDLQKTIEGAPVE